MKYDIDDLLKATYCKGEVPTEALNQTVLRLVKEKDAMKQQKELETGVIKQSEAKETVSGSGQKGKIWRSYSGMRKLATVSAVFGMVLILGAGVVHAAERFFGINYFWSLYGTGVSEDTKKLIEDNPVVSVKEDSESRGILECTVSSVLCDSEYVVVTLDVAVKDEEKYFLVTGVTDLTESISNLIDGVESSQTIEAYCQEKGLQPVQINTQLDKKTEQYVRIISRNNVQSGTGKGSLIISAERLTDDKSFTMGIKMPLRLNNGEGNILKYSGNTLQIDVKDKSTEQIAHYYASEEGAYHVPDTAITINEVKLKTTEVGTYSEITYMDETVSDDATEDWPLLSDAEGKMLSMNPVSGGACRSIGNNLYVASCCYEGIGLPETLYIMIGDDGKVIELKKK